MVILLRRAVCSFDDPFIVIQTAMIREACEVGRRLIRFLPYFELIVSSGELFSSIHLIAESNRNYRSYHFVLEVMIWITASLADPTKRFMLSCSDLTVSCVVTRGEVSNYIIVDFSTNN